jgi:hypothetical protein
MEEIELEMNPEDIAISLFVDSDENQSFGLLDIQDFEYLFQIALEIAIYGFAILYPDKDILSVNQRDISEMIFQLNTYLKKLRLKIAVSDQIDDFYCIVTEPKFRTPNRWLVDKYQIIGNSQFRVNEETGIDDFKIVIGQACLWFEIVNYQD